NAFARAALWMAMARHERMTPQVAAGYLAPYRDWSSRTAIYRFVADIPLSPRHPSYAALAAIEESLCRWRDRPLLLVWGLKDWCFTPHFLDRFREIFPQAEVERLADAGHYVVEDAFEHIVPRVEQFLAAHPLPGAGP